MNTSMSRSTAALSAVLLMLALDAPGAQTVTGPGAQTVTGTERRVTTAPADQFDATISGTLVVYTDFSGVDADVWYTDLSTGTHYPVSIAPGDQQLTGVSGNRIAYTDWNTMDVLVFDVTTGMSQNLTNAANSNALDPTISGNLIVWTDDRDGNAEIYARDLSTGEERRITDTLLADRSPAVGDGVIVWERCQGFACEVFAYEWATGHTRQLTATDYATERFPDVSGRVVVFHREEGTPIDKDVVAYDLDTATETELALPGDQDTPRISGDFAVFNDSASGTPHTVLWQLSTGLRVQVVDGASDQYLSDIDGARIVYTDTRNGTLDVYVYEFQIQAPPDDTQPPLITGAADLTVDATSPQGAVVLFGVSAIDDVDPAPALSCTPPSGTVFGVATTAVTCTAMDASGNSVTATFTVTVRGADAQLGSLADLVASLNLKRGLENSLDVKLQAAMAAVEAARAGALGTACHQLGAFTNEVTAQAGKAITEADAAALKAVASRIRAVLGCS